MSEGTPSRAMVGTFAFLLYGPILWALQLTLIYGGQSAMCGFGVTPVPTISTWVLAASALTLVLAIAGFVRVDGTYHLLAGRAATDEQWRFLSFVMRALTALSTLAMLYAAIPAVMLPACGTLR